MNETSNATTISPDDELREFADQEPIMKFFVFGHLPLALQGVSKSFATLAKQMMEIPRSAERAVALRKLLESKDAAVRATL